MKTKLFTLLTCLFFISIYGQINHTIDDNAIEVHNVCAADIDDDGDMDVLSASWESDEVAWYENTDGQGNFTKYIIASQTDAHHVCTADFDNDGDLDVIYSSVIDNTVAWCENTDGQGDFGAPQPITISGNGVHEVFPADFNGDGNMDFIVTYYLSREVAWYENDGLGNFVEQPIPGDAEGVHTIYTADLDNDGDMDALSASMEGSLFWYKNTDGEGDFELQPPISSGTEAIYAISASDMDGDGDIDVLASVEGATLLVLFENDGLGNFNEVLQIPTPYWVMSIHPVDFDDDGDMDILCAEYGGSNIGFIIMYINDGNENFTKGFVTTGALGAVTAVAAHINNDSVLDFVSGWSEADKVVWTEWPHIGVEENTLSDFTVYPNPTTGILNIETETTITQIEIYNQLGQLVLSNSNINTIDVSELSQGLYFCKIKDENGNTSTQKIIKK